MRRQGQIHPKGDPQEIGGSGDPAEESPAYLRDPSPEAGEDLKAVSERLGHSTITVTADRYAQVTPRLPQQTATTMEQILYKAQ